MLNALVLFVDRFPRPEQRERRQEGGEHQQQEADAVDADEIFDAERRNPGVALHELKLARSRIETRPEQQRLREHEQRHHERDVADERSAPLLVALDEEQQDGAAQPEARRSR